MSKQQSYMPEIEERNKTGRKKRKGKYELWQKCLLKSKIFNNEWHRIRTYESREIAEKNLKDYDRKWNYGDSKIKWLFEIRETKNTI